MYPSFIFHVLPVLHYIFAFSFLFVVLPIWLFKSNYEDKSEVLFSGYAKTTFLLIVSGYILVITKLFEVISIFLLFLVILAYRYLKQEKSRQKSSFKNFLLKKIFDGLDGIFGTDKNVVKAQINKNITYVKKNLFRRLNRSLLLEGSALIIILATSMYIRFYDAFANAAPPMADSYVTLAWMKYIDARQLFHDGIYPQGFHLYLASLLKFSAVDPLFILRYTGPLNAMLIVMGYYTVVRKITKNGIGALVAVFVAGILPALYPFFSLERQAATNSQEFGFVFIFPAVYFLYKYFVNREKEDLIVGLICTAIVGLVHTLAFALIGLLIGIMCFSSMITLQKKWKPILYVCSGALVTVGIALLPIGIGNLLGKEFHESSAEYLVSMNKVLITFQKLNAIDYIMLGVLFILFLGIFKKRISREERFINLFTLLTGVTLFALYYAGGAITQSTLITSRSIELWVMVLPFCIGIMISSHLKVMKEQFRTIIFLMTNIALIITMITFNPKPVIPYKLEHNENIEQYFHITETNRPKTWLAVSQDEGYSVSLGSGYHMHLGDFLKTYEATGLPLTRKASRKVDRNLPPSIFIFKEKKIFKVDKTNSIYSILEPKYKKREKEYRQLENWIKTYKQVGNSVDVFFEDENLIVYKLDIPKSKQLSKKLWSD